MITPNSSFDPTEYRGDFPVLSRQLRQDVPLVYLDNAASTQRPQAVMDAMDDCYQQYYANVHRGIHTLSEESTERYESARRRVASFVNAASEREIIFTAGTTMAINLIARSYGDAFVGPDDVIVTSIMEHHANIVPWQQLSQRSGCKIQFATLNDQDQLDFSALAEMIERNRPAVVAITGASNVLGTLNDVAAISSLAHQVGAVTVIDAAQVAPHGKMDVQAWDADFVVFSGHKLCGPSGIGVLYGRESLLEKMPPFLGGGAMIHHVSVEGFEPAGLPEKFEAGTPPIAEAIGLEAAIDYVTGIGLERISQYEKQLARLAHERLGSVPGIRILGPSADNKAGIVSFHIPDLHPHDLSQWLDRRGIAVRAGHHCAMPLHSHFDISASTRASFYFYNTPEEVELFAEAVASAHERFNRRTTGRGRRR